MMRVEPGAAQVAPAVRTLADDPLRRMEELEAVLRAGPILALGARDERPATGTRAAWSAAVRGGLEALARTIAEGLTESGGHRDLARAFPEHADLCGRLDAERRAVLTELCAVLATLDRSPVPELAARARGLLDRARRRELSERAVVAHAPSFQRDIPR